MEELKKIEATFKSGGGPDKPPTYLRVNSTRIYRVEWVRDVRPSLDIEESRSGRLLVSLEAYSEELDETLTATFSVRPAADDPTGPDWTSIQRSPVGSVKAITSAGRNFPPPKTV